MKRSAIILLMLVLAISFVSAVEIEAKDSFMQGETFLAKISGNFIDPILPQNVFFYRSHVRVPVDYQITKINDDYYIHAVLLNKAAGNDYSFSIEDVKYMKGVEIVEDKFSKNFSIANETADFSVKPGALSASEDFSVEVQNLQENPITVSISTEVENSSSRILVDGARTSSISLKSGEIGKLNFIIGQGEPALEYIKFSTDSLEYNMPVFIYSESGISGSIFGFEFPGQSFSFPTKLISKKMISLYNTGDSDISNISISLSDSLSSYVSLSKNILENIGAHSSGQIEVSFFSLDEKDISGTITAESENLSASMELSVSFIPDYTGPSEEPTTEKTCAELNGTVYNSETETCSTEAIYAKDNICCTGTVSEKEKDKSTGRIVAIVILVVIVLGLVWFYFKKYRKTKKPVNLINIAQGKK